MCVYVLISPRQISELRAAPGLSVISLLPLSFLLSSGVPMKTVPGISQTFFCLKLKHFELMGLCLCCSCAPRKVLLALCLIVGLALVSNYFSMHKVRDVGGDGYRSFLSGES